jgi:NitT/TauT family transport system permease protein
MIGKLISKRQSIVIGFSSILILILCYGALSHYQHVKEPTDTTTPNLTQLKEGVVNIFEADRRGERWIIVDFKATYLRLFLGMFAGVLGAVILGILMGCFSRVEAFFLPPLSILAKVPPTAALAIFFVACGTGWKLYTAMIAFGILPSLAQSIYLGVKDVPEELINKARTLGASKCELIWNVVVRFVMPKVIDAVRLQIGPAVVYLIAAEMVLAHEGFGYRIRLEFKKLNMNVVYPYLTFLALTTYFLDYGIQIFQRIVFRWYYGMQTYKNFILYISYIVWICKFICILYLCFIFSILRGIYYCLMCFVWMFLMFFIYIKTPIYYIMGKE